MKIKTFYMLTYSEISQLGSLDEIEKNIQDSEDLGRALISFDEHGQIQNITPTTERLIGEGNVSALGMTLCCATLLVPGGLVIRILERQSDSSFIIPENNPLYSFSCKKDYFKLNESLHDKLAPFMGVGSGKVKIDIKSQNAIDIFDIKSAMLATTECGNVIGRDTNTITLTCNFANAGANTVYFVK